MPLALGACQTTTAGDAVLSLDQTRTAIRAGKSKLWKDPDSLRDASISAPFSCMGAWKSATCACVEVNGRNSFGGYTGLRRYVVTVVDGAAHDVREAHTTDNLLRCERMQPFPELTARS